MATQSTVITLVQETRALCERVQAALDEDAPTPEAGAELAVLASRIRARLREATDDAAGLSPALLELTWTHRALRRGAIDRRLRALGRINEHLASLRSVSCVNDLMSAAAPALARCCVLQRVVVSRVNGAELRAEGVYGAPEEIIELQAVPLPLPPGGIECELIRRPSAILVVADDERAAHPLRTRLGSCGYVVCPVIAGGRTVGFVHADRPTGPPLTEADAHLLWMFATGLGVLFERTTLVERIAAQRRRVHDVFGEAVRQLRAMTDDEVLLSAEALSPAPGTGGLLTPREQQVMVLLVSGARNAEIATQLALSEATVKSYVTAVLRKLDVGNRAEAVSRYMTLTMGERETP